MSENEGFNELYEDVVQLPFPAADGKMYKSDACNTETIFRIIQSVPSPKAEPFKKWLAKVGYERIQEFQDPEIAIKRALTCPDRLGSAVMASALARGKPDAEAEREQKLGGGGVL